MAVSPIRKPDGGHATAPQHQAAFLTAFVKATVDTLTVQCAMKIAAGEPVAKLSNEEKGMEVVVVGGIVGTGIDCSVAFCFSEEACCHLVGSMLQKKDVTLDGDQVMAAASELVRIVGFQAKRLLTDRGYKVEAVFPRLVLEGKAIQIWADKVRGGVVIPFQTARGDRFDVEIF